MGYSINGKLLYGFALGNEEGGPLIEEVDEEGNWLTPWAVKLSQDPDRSSEDPDPIGEIEAILEAAGLDVGEGGRIKIVGYGHLEYGYGQALVTFEAEASWSTVTPVNLAELEERRQSEGWDALLAQAISILGITPIVVDGEQWDTDAPRVPVSPQWMVVAEYI